MKCILPYLFVGAVVLGNPVPIDHIEESSNIIGPSVLIVQVIGMFPYVKSQYGITLATTSGHQGIVLVGCGTDFQLPALVDTQPGPSGPKTCPCGRGEFFLEGLKGPKGRIDGIAKFPTGLSTTFGGHDLPKQRVVEEAPAIVAHRAVVHIQVG